MQKKFKKNTFKRSRYYSQKNHFFNALIFGIKENSFLKVKDKLG